MTGRPTPAHVPHEAYNLDTGAARESIRRLAALRPADRRRRPPRPDDRPGRRGRAGSRGRGDRGGRGRAAPRCSATASRPRPRCSGCTRRDESRFAPREPDAVAFAHTTEEVAAILRICSAARRAGDPVRRRQLARGPRAARRTAASRSTSPRMDRGARDQRRGPRLPRPGRRAPARAREAARRRTACSSRSTPAPTRRSAAWPPPPPRAPARRATARCARTCSACRPCSPTAPCSRPARAPASPRPATTSRGCCSARRARSR